MMAHEVNNTVGAVNSILSTVVDNDRSFGQDDRDEVIQMLGVALQRNYRLNKFMQNFSDVVKLPPPEKESCDVNRSLESVIQSFSPWLTGKKIRIVADLQPDLPHIQADQSQMEQVFINIIKNSMEAIETGGCITVTTRANPFTITISDDGPGLSGPARDRLFTPFFSTKTDGQGIGLTVVREILVNHGFQYRLSNREEGGAEFEIQSFGPTNP
jgi:signal transduction histidine kinase